MNIIFDLDGTLWDSRPTIIEAWNDVLKFENIKIKKIFSIEDMKPYIGLPQLIIVQELLPELSFEECNDLVIKLSIKENEYLSKLKGKLYLNVEETLKKLNQNHSLFIVSNCGEGYIETFLNSFNFHSLFTDFESLGRTQTSKKENIQLVIKRNNIKKAIYVGDTEHDSKAAKHNNIPFIFCEYGFGDTKEYVNKIKDFSELLQIKLIKNN